MQTHTYTSAVELPLELWQYAFAYLSTNELLRCAQCCRAWRFSLCWPLLVRRERLQLRFSGAAAASPYNTHSVLQWYSPKRAVLDGCISPLNVLQALDAMPVAASVLSTVTLRGVWLNASIVHLLSSGLPALRELTIEDCAFDGTLPALLHEPCWDMSRSGLDTLRFLASTCQWNEWSVFRLVQRVLVSPTSTLRRLELIQPSWSRVRRLLSDLGRRKRLDHLNVGVSVVAGGLVPLETMGMPVMDTEVTHLAMRVDGVSHRPDLNPCAQLFALLATSCASLRSLDVRNSTALTDEALARILAWMVVQRIQLESLALGGSAGGSFVNTGTVLPHLTALTHLHVENATGLDEQQLYSCREVRTLEIHGPCSTALVMELAAAPGRWSPVRWPESWSKV